MAKKAMTYLKRKDPKTGQRVRVTKTVTVPKMKDTTRAGVLAIVRKMLDRKIEDKRVGWLLENGVSHNSGIGPADCLPLVQQIVPIDSTTGDTSTQRIGDRLKPKSLRVRGIISVAPDQGSIQNLYVRVLILAQKDIKVGSSVAAGNVDTAHLLKPAFVSAPGLVEVPFRGDTSDVFAPINTDKFRVYYDKVHKLCPATNATVENTMGSYRWSYTFKDMPASFSYDAGNGDWANNFAPFCCVGYAYADGTAPDTVSLRIKSTYSSLLTYEDA